MPGVMPTQYPNGDCAPYHNENRQDPNSGVRKTAKPKVFTPDNIEASVIKALTPVLSARDGTIYSFSDWTLSVCPTSGFMPPYDSGTRHPFLLAQAG